MAQNKELTEQDLVDEIVRLKQLLHDEFMDKREAEGESDQSIIDKDWEQYKFRNFI